MKNAQGDVNDSHDGDAGNYDWSFSSNSKIAQTKNFSPRVSTGRFPTVPILVAMLTFLTAFILIGAVLLFLQRERDDMMNGASIADGDISKIDAVLASVQEKNGGDAKGQEGQDDASLNKEFDQPGRNIDVCKKIPSGAHGKVVFYPDALRNNDTLVYYCDGYWSETATPGYKWSFIDTWSGDGYWEAYNFDLQFPYRGGQTPQGCWWRESLISDKVPNFILDHGRIPLCDEMNVSRLQRD